MPHEVAHDAFLSLHCVNNPLDLLGSDFSASLASNDVFHLTLNKFQNPNFPLPAVETGNVMFSAFRRADILL